MDKEKEGIQRLRDEQIQAIQETEEKIQKFDQFANDYVHLQQRLKTLPDTVKHDIMVPFGKFAFMPGQLIHTNEILVLLGDNWFAERSAKQAVEIAGRRVEAIKKQIEDLHKQKGLLQPRLDFTSDLGDIIEERGEMFEIKEEYDEEKENKWKEDHRHNMKKHKQKLYEEKAKIHVSNESAISSKQQMAESSPTVHVDDDALWARLDMLEKQERRNREMSRDLSESEPNLASKLTAIPPLMSQTPQTTGDMDMLKQKPGVRWKDEDDDEDTEEYSDEDEDEDEMSEETDEEGGPGRPSTISFKHSTTPNTQHAEQQTSAAGTGEHVEEGVPCLLSPADIYTQFVQPTLDKPRSILKSASDNFAVQKDINSKKKTHHVEEVSPEGAQAFTGTIVEKPVSWETPVSQEPTVPLSDQTDEPPKRVSKFKAQRLKKSS